MLKPSSDAQGAMNSRRAAEAFDSSSDPSFVACYAEQSASPAAVARFCRIRDSALRLIASRGGDCHQLKVLDIGCGAGSQARLWAELGHQAFGFDVNQALIELGRKRANAQTRKRASA
jgi:2-polyprenyl-6-hydroxyphenyl methylase/3-demethylubiquinone-9 3-methyltransferase